MNNILEQVKSFQAQGIYCVPVPVGKKQPAAKHLGKYNDEGKPIYEWKNIQWTDDDFLDAKAFGIEHEKSHIIDFDFDDLDAIKFQHLLPLDTLVIGKIENGVKYSTHVFYKYKGIKKTIKLLEDKSKKDSVIIEVLTNTQTVAGGGNRLIINNVPPKELNDFEYSELIKIVRKISLMTLLAKYYPKQGNRDQYCLILAGCLARYTNWPTSEKENFLTEILKVVGDEEVKSRLAKITYQEEQLKDPKQKDRVYGIEGFSKEINVDKSICKDWWSWISNKELIDTTPITALNAGEFCAKEYPKAEYFLYPLVSKQTITQIWAAPGIGKTLLSLELACALANGQNFLKYKWVENTKPIPVLYVEGEMSANQLQERLLNITQRYQNEKISFNFSRLKIAPLKEQTDHCFEPLNTENGMKRLELQLELIEKEFNEKPIVFLDNVSCLTNFQEKDGEAWISFMNWLIRLRSKGYTIFFLHHATKEGSTSSGSNMKERSVDLEIKLSEPDNDQKLDLPNETQIVINFKKWREFNYTEHSKSFLASVSRHSFKWSWHELKGKKETAKEIAFNYWFKDQKIGIWSEDMSKHEEHPISKATFYRFKKQLNQNEEVTLNGYTQK